MAHSAGAGEEYHFSPERPTNAMAPVYTPGCVLIEWLMTLALQEIEITYHVEAGEPITIPNLLTLAGATMSWWSSDLAGVLSEQLKLRAVKCTDLASGITPSVEVSTGGATAGAVAQPAIANSLAFVITHTTAGRGRSARGRSYIPGIPVTSCPGNVMAEGQANALLSHFASLDTVLEGAGWTPVVNSTRTGNAPRPSGIMVPIINHRYTDLIIDNQRRRKPGVGG